MSYLYPKYDNIDKGKRKSKSISVHVMKEYGEVELWLQSFFNAEIEGGSHLIHTTSALHPKEPSATIESQAE